MTTRGHGGPRVIAGTIAFLLLAVLAPRASAVAPATTYATDPGLAAPSTCASTLVEGSPVAPDPSVSLVGLPPYTQLLIALAAGIVRESADQLTGWTISTIFSGQTETGKLREQLNEVSAKIDGLHNQISALDAEVKANYERQFTADERREYDLQTAFLNDDTAAYRDFLVKFDAWGKRPVGTPMDGTVSASLVEMRNKLGKILQHIDLAMVGQGQGRGMIEVYSSFLWRTQPGFASGRFIPDQFYDSDYTTPMNDMLDYWKGLSIDVFNLLTEVYHMSWTIGGVTYAADTDYIQNYYNCLLVWFDHWDDLAMHKIGRLADDVVVDHRTNLMWSRSAVPDPTNPTDPNWLASLSIGGVKGWRLPSSGEVFGIVKDPATPYPMIRPVEWMDAQGFTWPQYKICCGPDPDDVQYLVGRRLYVSDIDPNTHANKGMVITDDPSNPPNYRAFFVSGPQFVVVVRPMSTGLGAEAPTEADIPTVETTATVAVVATPTFTG